MISICLAKRNFFLPREQRNLAHLRQIHPHRIVRPRFVFLAALEEALDVDVQIELIQLGREVRARRG